LTKKLDSVRDLIGLVAEEVEKVNPDLAARMSLLFLPSWREFWQKFYEPMV